MFHDIIEQMRHVMFSLMFSGDDDWLFNSQTIKKCRSNRNCRKKGVKSMATGLDNLASLFWESFTGSSSETSHQVAFC
jgi:hypothetical protein